MAEELNYSTYSVWAARLHHTRGCCLVAMVCGLCCLVFNCSFRRPHLIFNRIGIELNETCFIIMMRIGILFLLLLLLLLLALLLLL